MSKKSSNAKIRLFVKDALLQGAVLELSKEQAHYLSAVMRRKSGDEVLLFNGVNGQWLAQITFINKKNVQVQILEQTKQQKPEPDVWLCFAPVKNAPINNLVQKATELGVSKLQPVITQHTIVSRVNIERLQSNAMEASEQSERLTVPDVAEPVKLDDLLSDWPVDRTLILCDESGGGVAFTKAFSCKDKGKYAILIGPEGGFAKTEFEIMKKSPYIKAVGMGPRILRADTAAIAALTCYMSILGDWDESPHFEKPV